MPGDLDRLRLLFRHFAATQARGRSAVYEALAEGVASDDALLGLLLATPADQRRPSLLFAAVNLLLASDPEAELAAYYPVHGGGRPVDDQLAAAFTAFCAGHQDELGLLLRTRSTQTNEIRRCVALRLGLDYVRRRWPGPVALVEAGASAGLNLLADRYGYRVGDRAELSADPAPLTISCDVRGDAPAGPVLGPVPQIASRVGLDQRPVDVTDPAARAWLEAFVWPEQTADLATLRAAIGVAVAAGVTVTPGDAVTGTARLIGDRPGREPVVVFTASLLSYLGPEARTAFAAQLALAAETRPVAWVFAESPALTASTDPVLGALAGPVAHPASRYLVGASLRGPGERDDALLALGDPYLRWLALARHRADDFRWLP